MAQPHTGGIGMMDERGQLERTSAAHLALSEGVRPSSSSPENNLKPRRGRPRLENTRDETAQDIRVAQRNYRQKKDQAANELQDRVNDLETKLMEARVDLSTLHQQIYGFTARHPKMATALSGAMEVLLKYTEKPSESSYHTTSTMHQPMLPSTQSFYVDPKTRYVQQPPRMESHASYSPHHNYVPPFSQLPADLPLPEVVKMDRLTLSHRLKWSCIAYDYKMLITQHLEDCKRIFHDEYSLNLYSLAITILNKEHDGSWPAWFNSTIEDLPPNMLSSEMVEGMVRQNYIFDEETLLQELVPKNIFLDGYPIFSKDDVDHAIAMAVHNAVMARQQVQAGM